MRLFDGRSEFYQYDLNQKLICDECAVGEEIHFSNRFFSSAAVCVTYELDGQVVVDVPNVYLLSYGELTAYRVCCDGDQTSTANCCTFNVVARKKPSDYVYTETEVKSYEALEARIERLENGDFVGGEGGTGKDGKDGVGIQSIERTDGDGSAGTTDTYTITMTDGSSYDFTVYNGADGEDGKDGADGVGGGTGGANGKDGITPHIGSNGNWFLGDTDTGVKAEGVDGKDGYTPVKGVDYFDGKDGQNGVDGITPHIGENKNWWIGDTDTGIKAEGKDGQNGVGGSGGSALDVYSTEETVVGTWIDGKPLYRKVFITTTPTVSTGGKAVSRSMDCSALNVDEPCTLYAGFVHSDDSSYTSLPVFTTGSNARTLKAYYSTATHKISVTHDSPSWSEYPITIIFEYTKTTDEATVAIPSAMSLRDAYEEGVNEA